MNSGYKEKIHEDMRRLKNTLVGLAVIFSVSFMLINVAPAINHIVSSQSASGNLNVTAIVTGPFPTIPAIIVQPANNSSFTTTALVVRGTCGPGLIVRIYNNNELAGSSACSVDGNFTINITLVAGKNTLSAMNYDAFDQAGPASGEVIVYVDPAGAPSTSPGSRGNGSDIPKPDDSIRIFAGTPLELIAIAWGIDITVSWTLHFIIASIIYMTLATIVIILLHTRRYHDDTDD